MTRVVVLGQPFWGTRIAAALNEGDMRAEFVPTRRYPALLGSLRQGQPLVLLRAGYRVGSPTPRGRIFDEYWSLLRRFAPRATAVHYWLGTDALNTAEDARDRRIRWGPVRAATDDLHLADAPWLAPELQTVGLIVVPAPVPQEHRAPAIVAPMPGTFRVLTYAPDARFAFYGGDLVLEAARAMPDVAFDVVGGLGTGVSNRPANVAWHGWVADMSARYSASSVVVRVPRHDGIGATVIEGLLHARHVVYTYDLPFTVRVDPRSSDALIDALTTFRRRHEAGQLTPNLDGRTYAIEAFDPSKLAANLRAVIRSRLA